jgi:propionyl-CoA carboxylase alpha subunit
VTEAGAVQFRDGEVGLVPENGEAALTVRYRGGAGEGADDLVTLKSGWNPGEPVWTGSVNGRPIAVQARPIPNGTMLSWRGAFASARVYTEREADYARLMPVKAAAGAGKKLLCPMPGRVKAIAVAEGQEVKAGETLAIVEAMKMENVLRAERDGTVKKLHAKAGDSLAVDAVIMEFA